MTTEAVAPVNAGRPVPVALFAAMRPRQWVKNLLVFAAPASAGVLDQRDDFVASVVAFVAFCLAASGTYLLNDVADREADRAHPTKRFRPIASGELAVPLAIGAGVVLLVASLAVALAVHWQLAVVVASYVAVTTAYTLWLKHVPLLDLVGIAAGFVLRAIAGGAAVDVPISDWFFIVTTFGSLFVVTGKRHAESMAMGQGNASTRSTLGEYSDSYLAYLRSVTSGVVLVAYCLWAFERAAESASSVPWFQLSIVPFALGVLRYALLVDRGEGDAPEELFLRDRGLQIAAVVWAVVFATGIYAG